MAIVNSMYTIDLLKGEGIPIRSRPGGIALASLIVVVPLLLGLALTSIYMDGRVVLSIQRQQLGKLETAAAALSNDLKKKELLDRERTQAVARLRDVKTALDGYTQWSQVLNDLVTNLSDTLVLTRLEAKCDTVRRKVPAPEKKDATGKGKGSARKVEISIPFRTLKLCVCGQQAASTAEAVRSLQDNLRSSPAIGPMLNTITVSQNTATLDSQEAVMYELECVMKTRVE